MILGITEKAKAEKEKSDGQQPLVSSEESKDEYPSEVEELVDDVLDGIMENIHGTGHVVSDGEQIPNAVDYRSALKRSEEAVVMCEETEEDRLDGATGMWDILT